MEDERIFLREREVNEHSAFYLYFLALFSQFIEQYLSILRSFFIT